MSDRQSSNTPLLLPELVGLRPEWLLGAINTKEAAEITGVPESSLITRRSTGGGPRFFQPTPRTVRYLRIDLFEWMLEGGLKTNTADLGTRVDLRSILLKKEGGNV